MNIDLQLRRSLEIFALIDESLSNNVPFENKIPFANIGFIKEKFWKCNEQYSTNTKKKSHPGLSLSSKVEKVAFGSSKTENRNRPSQRYFFVNKDECDVLSKDMVFILNYELPLNLSMIDNDKTDYAEISSNKKRELEEYGYK